MANTAVYNTTVCWKGEHCGHIAMGNGPEMDFSAPPDAQGHPGVLTPEEAFFAADNTCIMMMFIWAAERFKLHLVAYDCRAEGTELVELDRTEVLTHLRFWNEAGIISRMNEFQLLYFDGCPSWQIALTDLRQVIETENLDCRVYLIEITSPQQAQDERFLGSPSFRMNGVDLWPETRGRYNMSCRVYHTDHGMRGSPTVEMLREKIREILAK